MWTAGLAILSGAGAAPAIQISGVQANSAVNGDDVLTPNRARALVNNQATGFVGTVQTSGGNTVYSGAMTVGAEQELFITTNGVDNIVLKTITATTALLLCRLYVNNLTTARVLTVAGDTVTAGTAISIYAGALMYNTSIGILSTSSAILVFQEQTTGYLRAAIIAIDGTTVTENTSVSVQTGADLNLDSNAVVVLSSTSVMVLYYDWVTQPIIRARMLTVDGTSISVGEEFTVATNFYEPRPVKLTSTKVLVTYNNADTGQVVSRVLNSGAPITAGTAVSFGLTGYWYIMEAVEQTDTKVVVTFEEGDTPRYKVVTIDGNTVTTGSTGIGTGMNYDQRSIKLLDTQFFAAMNAGQGQVFTRANNVVTAAAAATPIIISARPCLLSSGKVLLVNFGPRASVVTLL